MDAIEIRPATLADAHAIGVVHLAAWRESYEGLVPVEVLAETTEDERAERWRAILGAPDVSERQCVFLAQGEDGAAVGFAACGRQRNDALAGAGYSGEFSAIYLLKKAQRRGVGRRLMTLMARSLLSRGFESASLWVLRSNFPARRFYEAMGGRRIAFEGAWRGVPEFAYGWRDLRLLAPHQ